MTKCSSVKMAVPRQFHQNVMCLIIWQASIVSVWMLTNESSHAIQGDPWVWLLEKGRWEDHVLLTDTAWKTSEAKQGCGYVLHRPEVKRTESPTEPCCGAGFWFSHSGVDGEHCAFPQGGTPVHVIYSCRIRAFIPMGHKEHQSPLSVTFRMSFTTSL